jgi:hypothetical protein
LGLSYPALERMSIVLVARPQPGLRVEFNGTALVNRYIRQHRVL